MQGRRTTVARRWHLVRVRVRVRVRVGVRVRVRARVRVRGLGLGLGLCEAVAPVWRHHSGVSQKVRRTSATSAMSRLAP